ncbi:MAG: MscL family protein, partial [Chloroflexi bacterium]|nr:MscL family protein [Chloroflexota bacterium]
ATAVQWIHLDESGWTLHAYNCCLLRINYGLFFTSIIDFGIIALALFLLVKPFKNLRAQKEEKPVTQSCPHCYTQIDQRATRCPQCTSPVKFEILK